MSGSSRSEVVAWSMYDFASSAFNTLIITFIFSRFFADIVVGDPIEGGVLWARAINISAVLVALGTPVLGAIADFGGRKKTFMVGFALQAIIFTVLLFFVGRPGLAVQAMIVFIVANVGFEAANVFYYALLPDVSTPRNIGRVSGLGFAVGYIGGLLALVIGLFMVRGWETTGYFNIRATILLVAAWYALFALPPFLILKDRGARRSAPLRTYAREGFHRLAATFRHLPALREAAKLLLARMIYNDGLVTIYAMASIYAGATLGMSLEEVLFMAIFLNLAAGIGAFVFGFIDDRIGGKRTIAISLVVLIAAALLGATTTTVLGFWIAAMAVGLMFGPNQAASRSLLSRLVPEQKHAEFFGLYAFSGKISSIFGPLLYGIVLSATANHRFAMGSMTLFFLTGLLLLLWVREREGVETARRLSRVPHAEPLESASA